ncbi:MAG: biopolymer transporter ExbD, partial [Bdellovibrionales bacterium]|nr:biopolymer transporter ExbD [Bdellovibrionales bacterium]
MQFQNDERDDAEAFDINLTPLIDVVFLLLIFFMVSTTFVESQGIEVNLPKAVASQSQADAENFTVSIRPDGALFLNEKPIKDAALKEQFRANPERLLVIRADEKSHHGDVVHIMDLARSVGLNRLAVATAA